MFQRLSLLLLCLVASSGCLEFGRDVTTVTPSAQDVSRCRTEMYIKADAEITPEGFKLTSGIDDAIWFRFLAHTGDIVDVFETGTVDVSKFRPGFTFTDASAPSWWDVAKKPLTGGQISLPNARFMNVGFVDNEDGTLTVYVMWHET
jgi:hypothetical protein